MEESQVLNCQVFSYNWTAENAKSVQRPDFCYNFKLCLFSQNFHKMRVAGIKSRTAASEVLSARYQRATTCLRTQWAACDATKQRRAPFFPPYPFAYKSCCPNHLSCRVQSPLSADLFRYPVPVIKIKKVSIRQKSLSTYHPKSTWVTVLFRHCTSAERRSKLYILYYGYSDAWLSDTWA